LTKAVKKQISPYEKLSKVLNTIPNGFPEVEDGSHLRVLEWIYEPEEAELASKLKVTAESVEKMAKRLKIPEYELGTKLERMESKGQLRVSRSGDTKKYGLLPFVVGIYEEQIHRMDTEFAELFEDYIQKCQGKVIFST